MGARVKIKKEKGNRHNLGTEIDKEKKLKKSLTGYRTDDYQLHLRKAVYINFA